jgi:simple sugar transport system permease protein
LRTISADKRRPSVANAIDVWRQKLAESPIPMIGLVLALVFIFFAFAAPNFLSFYVLSNILTFASVYGIITVGVAFLMISGEFDLSVGSMLAVSAYAFVFSLLAGVPPLFALFLTLLAGSLMGLINGVIVVSSGIPSFIATLGTLLAYRGIAHALGKGQATSYTPEVKPVLFDILNGYLAPLNQLTDPAGNVRVSSAWFILVVLVMSIVLMRTRYGNWTFAAGGNPGAANALGVNLKRVKLLNFVISGFMAGLAGAVLFAQRSSMFELLGEGLELTAVAACVIGGVALTGGTGSIVGAALGILLLSTMEQGLVLMGVPNDIFRGIVGATIIISVVINRYIGQEE